MPPRSRRLLLLTACVLLAWPAAPAAADGAPVLAGPPDGAEVPAGTPLALNARAPSAATGLWLHVSAAAAAAEPCGAIAGEVVRAEGVPVPSDPSHFSFPSAPRTLDTAGTYFWQVHLRTPDGGCVASAIRRLVITSAAADPAPPPGSTPPASPLSREPIPGSIGSSNRAALAIRVGGRPADVGRARFVTLVRNSAARWRLRVTGTFGGRPVLGDGRSEVGFDTRHVGADALATTHVRRLVRGAVVIERDIFIRVDVAWQAGPTHPAPDRFDLETVLLHELGHFAGNLRHVPRGCHNTPMIVALNGGEWWRSTSDFSLRGCAPGGPSRASLSGGAAQRSA